jgi:TDG/mug DNA glycosylase family protein
VSAPARPTREDLQAAYGKVGPGPGPAGLDVLLCGINPSLWSGAVGLHFATPGNRLWPTLHLAGWTDRRLQPHETDEVLAAGLGITNLVMRLHRRADELTDDELRDGLPRLEELAERVQPHYVGFLGLSSFRVATGRRRRRSGRRSSGSGPSQVWLLPNPSGLNASWQLPGWSDASARCARRLSGGLTGRVGRGWACTPERRSALT